MGGDLDPFTAASDYREDSVSSRNDPHIVLQLRHVFLGRGFLRERPGQHELGLEDCAGSFNSAVQCGRHPAEHRMPDPLLNIGDYLSAIGLIPAPVQVLGRNAKLDDEIARKVFGLDLAPLLPPEAEEGALVIPNDDTGVGAADEITAVTPYYASQFYGSHSSSLLKRT